MIGFVSHDLNQVRLLCCGDNSGVGYDTGGQMHPTLSPDGKLLMWTSNMAGSGGFQIFVVKVPTT
jgi:Tol biopolymer transport system component